MSTKYVWTDWITHVPGQELIAGMYVRVEYLDRNLSTSTAEGRLNAGSKGHGCWHARTPHGKYLMITRYKLCIESDAAPEECAESIKQPELA